MTKPLISIDVITARHAAIRRNLKSGRSFTSTDLAEEFEVSRRTIYRDISYLRRCGVIILFDESNKTYYA